MKKNRFKWSIIKQKWNIIYKKLSRELVYRKWKMLRIKQDDEDETKRNSKFWIEVNKELL